MLRIPVNCRARRVIPSPSFRKEGKTTLSVIRSGKKEKISVTTLGHEPGQLGNVVMFSEKGDVIGEFRGARTEGNCWRIYHRIIDPNYRGYFLGRIGFRYIEQLAKNNGATEMSANTDQPTVISTLLKLGYELAPESKKELTANGISPNKKRLIAQMKKCSKLSIHIKLRKTI